MPSKQQSKSRRKSNMKKISFVCEVQGENLAQIILGRLFMLQSDLDNNYGVTSDAGVESVRRTSSNTARSWATEKVSLQTVAFMAAFCRRNLSSDEIAKVGVFVDAAYADSDDIDIQMTLDDILSESQEVVQGLGYDAKLRDLESAENARSVIDEIVQAEGPHKPNHSYD